MPVQRGRVDHRFGWASRQDKPHTNHTDCESSFRHVARAIRRDRLHSCCRPCAVPSLVCGPCGGCTRGAKVIALPRCEILPFTPSTFATDPIIHVPVDAADRFNGQRAHKISGPSRFLVLSDDVAYFRGFVGGQVNILVQVRLRATIGAFRNGYMEGVSRFYMHMGFTGW